MLALTRGADAKQALSRTPWRVIVMVCGVAVLAEVANRAASAALLPGFVAVVMPALLPAVPHFAEAVSGAGLAMTLVGAAICLLPFGTV